jgi:flagellar FliL protein
MVEPIKKKSSKLKPTLIAVPVLLSLVCGGLWFTGVLPHLLGMNQGEKKAAEAAKPPQSYVEIPEMIDNLDDPRRLHYVKLSARVEVLRPEDVQLVKSDVPELQNLLVVYMRNMDTAELHDPTDTDRLRGELLSRANAIVAPAKISDILFTQILVQ